jgi:Uma2 family endonuclease
MRITQIISEKLVNVMKTVSSELNSIDSEAKLKEKVSYEDFLVKYKGTRAEWVDGETIMAPPASRQHQDVVIFLVNLLSLYVESHNLGTVLIAPFQMKLGPDLPGREPDLLYVAPPRLDRLKDTYMDGPADMVIEIISKDSVERDRDEKFVEYEAAGVSEYWLIDPIREQADFYRLAEDDHYHPILPDDEGIYHSEVVAGFWLRVSWLWQEPLPRIWDILRELGLL